jgi:hypothetical protein
MSNRNTTYVTFRVCSVDGIAFRGFVMRSGVSYYPYLGYDHFMFVIGIITHRVKFFSDSTGNVESQTQLLYSEFQQDYQSNSEG